MKTVAIVQARMTSTRLPGKVLADLEGAPMLERQLARLGEAKLVDAIAIATTVNTTDDPVALLGRRLGLTVTRGSELDVLSRYVSAAAASGADRIVRITADCPLLDGGVVDRVIEACVPGVDYASNVLERSYPRGLDVEVFTRDALERTASLATSAATREHVTWFVHSERPDLFRRVGVRGAVDASDLRWTVDTPEDLAMVRAVYAAMGLGERHASYAEILAWVRSHPEVSAMNAGVDQKPI